ncbi:B-cell receptor-associated protein 31 isoform X1 [Rhipicephalus sanguineus]|uniref:B-cell receptor-associated protein 31 isoform X1 n=1 Tax=Rhipicephalus sanguineus TaxID=34632 RepID=UPI00189621D3|nr:B-cell receptor-associated protein 31 isoform X1 [Rhipicephalus sanguineus]
MSFQWTIVAAFLYAEIAIVLLLMIPFISPRTWNKLFKSRFLKSLGAQADIYFTVMIVVLVLFFFDSIREMRKYGAHREEAQSEYHHHGNLDVEMQQSMKMFRAQRNFYIAGFALFLWLVIRRLVTLISAQAVLLAVNEASMKQAQSATEAAQNLLKLQAGDAAKSDNTKQNEGNSKTETLERDIKELKTELEKAQKEVAHLTKDRDALKLQAENLSKEYDRLCEEHSKAQAAGGEPMSKKDN